MQKSAKMCAKNVQKCVQNCVQKCAKIKRKFRFSRKSKCYKKYFAPTLLKTFSNIAAPKVSGQKAQQWTVMTGKVSDKNKDCHCYPCKGLYVL